MDEHPFKLNDRVIIDPAIAPPSYAGVVYRVKEILKVNLLLDPEGGGKRVKAKPHHLLPAPADPASPTATVTLTDLPPMLAQGTIVTSSAPHLDGLYVAIRENDRTVSIVRLGGDNNRYWRVPRSTLTVVDPARITLAPDTATLPPSPAGHAAPPFPGN